MSSLVPEGWSRKKLGDSLIPRPKSKLPSGESNPLGYYDFYVCSHKVLKSFHNEYSSPSILFSTGGEASVHLATERYAFSTDVWATEFEGDICNDYVFRLLEENIRTINYSGFQGSGIKHLDKSFIEKLEFSIPPLPEQKKIASILTSVDEVIENTQQQIDKLQDLKKATMNELLTKGIGHTEFKDSELGRIPKSWEVSLIGEVCEVGTGKKDTQNKMKYGKYPFFVRSQTIERIDSYSFDGEAILTAGDGVGTGKVFHYVNGRFDFHQRVYKLSDFRGGAIGKFLYYCFSSRFLKQVQQFSARGSVESVRMEMITGMAIPLPSIQEQSKIVDCISAIETNVSISKQKLSQTQSLKKSLMQDLLTGKVRVAVN